jgi:hypothetical protein
MEKQERVMHWNIEKGNHASFCSDSVGGKCSAQLLLYENNTLSKQKGEGLCNCWT